MFSLMSSARHSAPLLVAWTTVARREEAERLARDAVTRRLAACVQIDGPISSFYQWKGQLERAEEFRLTFKFSATQQAALEQHILATHPYDTPEWIVVQADHVSEKYLSWVESNPSTQPL